MFPFSGKIKTLDIGLKLANGNIDKMNKRLDNLSKVGTIIAVVLSIIAVSALAKGGNNGNV